MNRLFLYSGFLFLLILIFDAYDRDYNQPKVSTLSQENNITQGETKGPPSTGVDDQISSESVKNVRDIQRLENNKLFIEYDAKSGELLFVELKNYPVSLGSDDKIVILDYNSRKYTAASSVQVRDLKISPTYSIEQSSMDRVILSSDSLSNVSLTKEIKLIDDSHQISVKNIVRNNGNSDGKATKTASSDEKTLPVESLDPAKAIEEANS